MIVSRFVVVIPSGAEDADVTFGEGGAIPERRKCRKSAVADDTGMSGVTALIHDVNYDNHTVVRCSALTAFARDARTHRGVHGRGKK